ncbi:MAG: lipoprotein-releasing system transmembrane subunit LolC [Candidatus Omnitrophica bacterium CG12_big_fil_rev_8_21_14_0_65_43_15]|uniref:Lipoprotein-releasing system transmembrane subunit LolC n=1 Tax=Candidatus Taenaricola geysiri TaxID=1974752 RepID=A0A2J0LLP3_9BACT|nr:MAG: hypothetical protein AUJ89_02980 [Candidatus Omnitrophica bacterium CG1_02_43_210]PIR65251.1 MAG: lipoprotein-releasing system transmembrane subunit LolC [Candidatus Omnitrophica bacterium CG10_big_fil_rev_8_21_14_0_10_43_8]PIV12226.1 MAG: lipoprotein-releasing system transmembrane subunit LolC [Candidatus Omnitrophica bacterium CG03_land_8_20_14_0_80_43_22]PIW66523.1 MAG: lipoprotein-releasing system transmembrane subunit LolC [Candidatus Omnitrophica bacterium CG12_big_fil_rev_8_21_14_
MRFELFIAWRYITARRREKFISLVGVISVLGVAIGVAALIVVLSVMAGFDNDLKEKIIGANPHVSVENTAGMSDVDPAINRIKNIPGVVAVSEYINGQVILKTRQMTMGVLLRAMNLQRQGHEVVRIKDYIIKGSLPRLPGQIAVGSELARMFDLKAGSELSVLSPVDGKKYNFQVSGIFKCGMYDYDSNVVFCGINDAQNIFASPGAVSGIGIKLKNAYLAESFARKLRMDLNYMYTVKTWADLNSNLFSALKLEKLTMFVILALIVIVACFNIASTLIMMVLEKIKDIGILKSIGATRRTINIIFTLQGLLIGFIGTLLGLGAGLGLCGLLKKYQFIQLPKEIYYIDHLPIQIQYSDITVICVAAVLISLAATVYPAKQAARLEAVEALRYE